MECYRFVVITRISHLSTQDLPLSPISDSQWMMQRSSLPLLPDSENVDHAWLETGSSHDIGHGFHALDYITSNAAGLMKAERVCGKDREGNASGGQRLDKRYGGFKPVSDEFVIWFGRSKRRPLFKDVIFTQGGVNACPIKEFFVLALNQQIKKC